MLSVPYNNYLKDVRGTFIQPNGEIVSLSNLHENFARDYCFGYDYDFFSSIQSGESCFSYEDYYQIFKQSITKDTNPFLHSCLSSKEFSFFIFGKIFMNLKE